MGIAKKLSVKKSSSNTSLKSLEDTKSLTVTPMKNTSPNPASDDTPVARARVQLAVSKDSIVTSTVNKPTKSAHVGIGVVKSKESDSILISTITKAGLFADSNLKEGQRILKINGTPCPKDVAEVKSLFVSCLGQLTIVAGDVIKTVGTVTKKTKATKVGISLRKDDDTNAIMIFAITANGLFAQTDLRVGQMVLTINGESVPKDVVAVARMISEATSTLTIVAADVEMGEEEHKAVMVSLSKKLSILTEANKTLSATEQTLKSQVTEKSAKLDEHTSLLQKAKAEKDSLLKTKQDLEQQLSAKDMKIASLKAKIADVDKAVSSLAGANKDLSASQSNMKRSLSNKDLQIAELEAKVSTLDSERSKLSKTKNAAASEASAQSSKVAKLEAALSQKDSEIAELIVKVQALEKQNIVEEIDVDNEPAEAETTSSSFITPKTATVGIACLASVGLLLSKRK